MKLGQKADLEEAAKSGLRKIISQKGLCRELDQVRPRKGLHSEMLGAGSWQRLIVVMCWISITLKCKEFWLESKLEVQVVLGGKCFAVIFRLSFALGSASNELWDFGISHCILPSLTCKMDLIIPTHGIVKKTNLRWWMNRWSSVPRTHSCSVAQLRLTLCDPMDYCPPGSSVHGVFPARILE